MRAIKSCVEGRGSLLCRRARSARASSIFPLCASSCARASWPDAYRLLVGRMLSSHCIACAVSFSRLRAKQDTDTLVPYPLRALPLADTDEDFLPLHPGGSVRYECAPVPSAALDHWGFEYAAPEILAVHHPVAGWQDRFARAP